MKMWRTQIFHGVLFLFVFVETYRNDGQCAVCLEEGCKTGVNRIILDKCDKPLWQKKNKIPECSVGNLKPDAPCMISNGNLVLRAEQPLHFEDTDVGKIFRSTNMPCSDLDLPADLKPSSGQCAVCLEEGCKTSVNRIILDKCDETLWHKINKIPECSVGNLKPDAPCMISNGSLVLRTEQPLHFEGKDGASGGWKTFHWTNMPCADLDLPAGLKPSSVTGQCAVCLEEGCKTGVSRIILAKAGKFLWQKLNEIPECFVGNLKPDAPCMMSNGSLVLRTEQTLYFEDTDVGKTFHWTNMLCADLDLAPSLKSPSGAPDLNQINATANPTTTPASAWPLWKSAITVCGSVFAVIVIIGVIAIVIYRRRHKRHWEGRDGERLPDKRVILTFLM